MNYAPNFKAGDSRAMAPGYVTLSPAVQAAPKAFKSRPSAESATYPDIVAVLNERWRVIACPDRLQWILQRCDIWKGTPLWRGRSLCSTRNTLLRCIVENVIGEPASTIDAHALERLHAKLREHAGTVDAAALDVCRALPERIRTV